MMKMKLFLLLAGLFFGEMFSQSIDRIIIEGKIGAPSGIDLEGITVFNELKFRSRIILP